MTSLNIILLHALMVDKQQALVTTSLTMIDVHDIARSCRTYDVDTFFVAHPAPALRKLTRTLRLHWQEGFGSTYNPNRREALERLSVVNDLDEAIRQIDTKWGRLPKLIATSARSGAQRCSFQELRQELDGSNQPYLLMLGTGWGMSDQLLQRADYFLAPIQGASDYNHLSVRSAAAIMLDRLLGK